VSELPTNVEVGPDAIVTWMYPNIYKHDPRTGQKTPLSQLRVGISHVRAADELIIEYDSERDGYVIRMDKTVDRGSYMDTVQEAVEVAFIPAWNEAVDMPPGADLTK
jgi:hypothetical protein